MAPTKKTVKKTDTFMKPYIRKISHQVHPDLMLNGLFVNDLNHMAEALLVELVHATLEVIRACRRVTLGVREAKAATNIVLKGELKKNAKSEGTKAVTKFTLVEVSGNKVPKASRAGLEVSPTRVKNFMEQVYKKEHQDLRCSETAAVFMAAVLEYLFVEILEVSGNVTKDHKKKKITTASMRQALETDKELRCTLCFL